MKRAPRKGALFSVNDQRQQDRSVVEMNPGSFSQFDLDAGCNATSPNRVASGEELNRLRMLIDCGVVICNPLYRFAAGIVDLVAGMDVITRAATPITLPGGRVDDKIPVRNARVVCKCAGAITEKLAQT
jgi:hypothetical protein